MKERSLTSQQKGGIGEALIKSHRYELEETLHPFLQSDLRTHDSEKLPEPRDEYTSKAEQIPDDSEYRFQLRRTNHTTYHLYNDGKHLSWSPDCIFNLDVTPLHKHHRVSDRVEFTIPIEVKTGSSSSLDRQQRETMEVLEANADPIVPIRARVRIDELPEKYKVKYTRIHARHNSIDRRTPDTPDG